MAARKRVAEVLTSKTCKQITDLVYGYLNGKLSATVKKDFQQHLRVCPDCVNFLNTYKKTVRAAGSLRIEDLPSKVRKNILAFLHRRVRGTKASA
jgi:hypothetical protein